MIKPDHWIKKFGRNGGIEPYTEEHVNSASYDVTLGNHFICPTRDPQEFEAEEITLFPGEVVLATSIEVIRFPRDVAGDLKLKSTLGRLWLNHSMSGWFDPNFQGQCTLEFQNLAPEPRKLKAGTRVAQMVFFQLEEPPEIAYGEKGTGHYQEQKGATRPWTEEFFPKK
jgi:dCTP deaminase